MVAVLGAVAGGCTGDSVVTTSAPEEASTTTSGPATTSVPTTVPPATTEAVVGSIPNPGLFGVEELIPAPAAGSEIFLSFHVSDDRATVMLLLLRCVAPGVQSDVIAYDIPIVDGRFETGFADSPAGVTGTFVTSTSAAGTITNPCDMVGSVEWEAVFFEEG